MANVPSLSDPVPSHTKPSPPLQAPAPPPAPAQSRSFYQRQLPPSCVSFTSPNGKSLFRSALAANKLEAFFTLASQLVTQHDPSFCGLATLCTILNALGVDPKRVWRHPWRWYEQDMLDCCRPLDEIRKHGITLAEFNCLARCNGLALTTRSPPPPAQPEPDGQDGLAEFRAAVAEATASASSLMAVSFCRATLGQTGTGHFSPLAAYAPEEDRVLVLDVARFKYPSYWVRLVDLYESMRPLDPATGRPRGYTLLRYSPLLDASCQACQPAPPSATRVTLNKSSWTVLSRALEPTRTALANEPLPAAVATLVASLGSGSEPPIEVRPGSEALAKDLFSLISKLPVTLPAGQRPEPLATLFALALLYPNPETLATPELLKHEITYLKAQLDALGECCQIEVGGSGGELRQEEPHVCGCKKAIT